MSDANVSERAVALVNQALDIFLRAEDAPLSPMSRRLTAEMKRNLRRGAVRLRRGQVEPRYKNLHTAEELANIYEWAVQRAEIIDQAHEDFVRISLELDRLLNEHGSEARKAIDGFLDETTRSAMEEGPDSEAARRSWYLQFLGWFSGRQQHSLRRQRVPPPLYIPVASDPLAAARGRMTAAERLDSLPPDEAVIAIPPEGQDSGRGRVFIRIGLGEASWIGSFERGLAKGGIIAMLPDHQHLLVSADGAGYIIDLQSRTLVETIGLEVVGFTRDEPLTLCVVDHNGRSLEAFGRNGRLWKTGVISSGGFRRLGLTDDEMVGEARRPGPAEWVPFSVKLATGEVTFDARD